MAVWAKATLVGAEDAIAQFGRDLRFARTREGLTQLRLEYMSGVDQTLISRLELGKAPHVRWSACFGCTSRSATAFPSVTVRTTIDARSGHRHS